MATDNELLRAYARDHAESAFAELVQRHISLVYLTAVRETGGDSALAEDVSQMVFTELARKAGELERHPAMAGWLYTCVRRMAANVRRARDRRERRELVAHTMSDSPATTAADAEWEQIRPVLDDALHELGESDRTAVVLRLLEERSLAEVGEALGVTENAARMRVERALEKLRGLLGRRGITSTASGLAGAIAVGAAGITPSGLAATITAGAMNAATTAGTVSTLSLFMATSKLKMAVASALLASALAFGVTQYQSAQALALENAALRNETARLAALERELAEARKTTVDAAELARLRDTESRLQVELARLRAESSGARLATAEAAAAQRQAASRPVGFGTNFLALAATMSRQQAASEKDRKLAELARLKTRLQLTPEQEQAVQKIMLEQAESLQKGTEWGLRLLSGQPTEGASSEALAKRPGAYEEEIKAVLSPAQQAEYQAMKQEELTAGARVSANTELARMQKDLHLTEQQQDQLYPVLYDMALQQKNPKTAGPAPELPKDGDFLAIQQWHLNQNRRRAEDKARTLEPFLSAHQLQLYRQQQEARIKQMEDQSKLINGMIPKAKQ